MMPRLRGPEALQRMQAIRPGLKAVFVSGYAGPPSELSGPGGGPKLRLLQKPFTAPELAEELRRVVGTAGDSVTVVAAPTSNDALPTS
jgi:CheY-like chemotaxis protein